MKKIIENTRNSAPYSPSPYSAPSCLSPTASIFGNGWYSFELADSVSHLSIKGPYTKKSTGILGVKLIQTSLIIAYHSLLHGLETSPDLASQMFRFAVFHHSRHELLVNLRWFLGPRSSSLETLGRAVFGFDHTVLLQLLVSSISPTQGKYLNPLVDQPAL